MIKQSLTDRRAMLGRLTLELTNKRGALTPGERLKLNSLRAEMDSLEEDISSEEGRYRHAFNKGLRFGFDSPSLTLDERNAISSMNILRRELENRDMSLGTSQGAYPRSRDRPRRGRCASSL